MRLPFQQKKPEPKGWWSGTGGSSSSDNKKKPLKEMLHVGRVASNRQIQKLRPTSHPKTSTSSRKKQGAAQSRVHGERTTASKVIRRPPGKDKSFLDNVEESVCTWCESVENSNLYYVSAYPINAIMEKNKPKRRRR
jgi:hypothetical protein